MGSLAAEVEPAEAAPGAVRADRAGCSCSKVAAAWAFCGSSSSLACFAKAVRAEAQAEVRVESESEAEAEADHFYHRLGHPRSRQSFYLDHPA